MRVTVEIINYYCANWPWLSMGLLLNGAVFFCIKKHLKKIAPYQGSSFSAPLTFITQKDCLLTAFVAIIFSIQKTLWLGRDSVDIMESGNYIASRAFSMGSLVMAAHQFLYHALVNIVMRIFAIGPQIVSEYLVWIGRFISVLFGIFITILFYRFSFLVFKNRFIAYAGIVLLNIHGLFLFYCRRLEYYVVFSFVALLSFHFFWKTFIAGYEKRIWKYCLVTILCFFTHYLTLLILFSQFFAILVLKLRKYPIAIHSFWRFIKAQVLFNFIFILYFPFIYFSLFNNSRIFIQKWENTFYLEKEYIFAIIYNIFRLVFGLPPCVVLVVLACCFMIFVLLKFQKENTPLFLLLVGIVFSCSIYEMVIVSSMWRMPGRLYFNVRHFVWVVPFIVLIYSYGFSLLREKIRLPKLLIIVGSLLVLFIWNSYIAGKIIVRSLSPSYREAVYYIENNLKVGDCVVWPSQWISSPVGFYLEVIEPYRSCLDKYGSSDPEGFLRRGETYERIWLIIPWEEMFGMPHLSVKTLGEYLQFAKENFTVQSCWKGNQIDVYLFTAGQGNYK